jgi:hypothetical protein
MQSHGCDRAQLRTGEPVEALRQTLAEEDDVRLDLRK